MNSFWDKSEADRLKEFRNILIAARRKTVQSALENNEQNKQTDPTAGAQWGADLKAIQDQIDAIDRALTDEKS